MERLQSLFLGEGVSKVKFRWLVFYGFVVAGLAFLPLQSWLFLEVLGYWEVAIYHIELVWIMAGAMGALLAFKPMKEIAEDPPVEALASS